MNAGDTELTLMDSVVNWRIGDHIVLASTGTRHKQTQNEEVEITGKSESLEDMFIKNDMEGL